MSVRVTIKAPIEHRCPFRNERDLGTVTISWSATRDRTLELHNLARTLETWLSAEISHEALTHDLATLLTEELGEWVDVRTEWSTAGMPVVVDAVLREPSESSA